MSEKLRIAKATAGLLGTLGYSLKAVRKFREGEYEEGMNHIAEAIGTAVKYWDDIDYTWNQLRGAVDNIWGTSHQSVMTVVQAPRFENGFFTGKWFSSDRRLVEFLYHDAATNAVSLCSPRSTAGYNVYTGGIDLEREVLVWTGYNSANHELLIVGSPDHEGHNIYCHTWQRNRRTDQFGVVDQFLISRM